MPTVQITRTKSPKVKPQNSDLGFGKYFTDHMFQVNFAKGKGWYSPRITPYEPLLIEPGASVLHYGQGLFEGMKSFRQHNGQCVLFRPQFNAERIRSGADRLCMESPPQELMLNGIRELVKIDQDWIPGERGTSLYIRPTLIGTESFLGVRPSNEYLFYVICCPVGSYYAAGSDPVKIWVEDKYVRASQGGLGATKAGANYAASLRAALEAKNRGYAQVLWLDVSHRFIEEVGTMNVFFVFENEIVTPALNGTILAGGVRDCTITLLKHYGLKITERELPLSEVIDAHSKGKLKEVFGTGTAAVISPVGHLASEKFNIKINNGVRGPLATRLFQDISDIQSGLKPDQFNWIEKL